MFNLYPGQGLGLQAHKELAFGLGAFEDVPVPPDEEAQQYYGGRYEWDQIYSDRLITEDEEVLEIIIAALTSGVFE